MSKRLPHHDDNLRPDVGEETGDASSPRPDSNVVDEIGDEVGMRLEENEPFRPVEKVAQRDEQRWELDPASSEDFAEREQESREPSED